MNDRRILITCLVLLLISCLVLCCASLLGAGIYFWSTTASVTSSSTEQISNYQIQPQTDAETAEDQSNLKDQSQNQPPSVTDLDPEITRQMDEIQMQVIMDRGLEPSENVNRLLYTPEQLREKIKQDFDEEYSPEEAHIDAITLASFGLLEPDFDLYNFQIDLLSEQIGGFYDQTTGEMVIVQGESFGGVERFTYAHEYTHALQDQNYDMENGLNFNNDSCDQDSERCAAVRALIEGDATMAQFNWFLENATSQDQVDIMTSLGETDMPVFDSAPDFITLDLLFPYETGYAFAQYLYDSGGWDAVDRAYLNPPVSTEQILHPERYPADRPDPVNLPEFDGVLSNPGWEEIDRGVMGEWYTYLFLSKGLNERARLDENQAKLAAEGWGGDAYIVFYNADAGETLMIFQSIWDTAEDADEFASSFREYADGRFGNSSTDTWQGADGYHIFKHQADTTTWILAPDAETAELVWQTIQP